MLVLAAGLGLVMGLVIGALGGGGGALAEAEFSAHGPQSRVSVRSCRPPPPS
jgi:hypothetical protein